MLPNLIRSTDYIFFRLDISRKKQPSIMVILTCDELNVRKLTKKSSDGTAGVKSPLTTEKNLPFPFSEGGVSLMLTAD